MPDRGVLLKRRRRREIRESREPANVVVLLQRADDLDLVVILQRLVRDRNREQLALQRVQDRARAC